MRMAKIKAVMFRGTGTTCDGKEYRKFIIRIDTEELFSVCEWSIIKPAIMAGIIDFTNTINVCKALIDVECEVEEDDEGHRLLKF